MRDEKMSVLVPAKAINRAHRRSLRNEAYVPLMLRTPVGYQIWIPESIVHPSEYGSKIVSLHLTIRKSYTAESVEHPRKAEKQTLSVYEIEDMFDSRVERLKKDYQQELENNWKARYTVAKICYLYGDQKDYELGLISPDEKLYPIRGLVLEDIANSDVKCLRTNRDAKFYHAVQPLFKARLRNLCENLEDVAALNNAYISVSKMECTLKSCEGIEAIAEFTDNVRDIIDNEYQSIISRFITLVDGNRL